MSWRFSCLLASMNLGLSLATAQEPQEKSASTVRQPDPEMQKLFNAFLGTWRVNGKFSLDWQPAV
jgi:hypothetical protein